MVRLRAPRSAARRALRFIQRFHPLVVALLVVVLLLEFIWLWLEFVLSLCV